MGKHIKTYAEYMKAINADCLLEGLLGEGLFPPRIPPVFTSAPFLGYVKMNNTVIRGWKCKPTQYITYESMRNTNTPRIMGIPNPITYAQLCLILKDEWGRLTTHFEHLTQSQDHKVSRIHLRKMAHTTSLFEMNYSNHYDDGDVETDLELDSRYVVEADISTCFPSMYSHALAWALVGKPVAKSTKGDHTAWYNKLDEMVRNLRDGETNGFLIGPHASNLLSEVILCAIDDRLKEYKYIRHIDDYKCFVSTSDEAERFLTDLGKELKEFGLSLNHKKTKIVKLPVGQEESWVNKLENYFAFHTEGILNYKQIHAFIEYVIDLLNETGNAAIVNFAMKMIARRNLSENARVYYTKQVLHLALLYPYLIFLLDECLFVPFATRKNDVRRISEKMYGYGMKTRNAELVAYALYFAMRYKFSLTVYNSEKILGLEDCVLNTVAWMYARDNQLDLTGYVLHAQEMTKQNDVDRNWLFVYEVLPKNDLNAEWKKLKAAKVSFVKPNQEIVARISPDYEGVFLKKGLTCSNHIFIQMVDKIMLDVNCEHKYGQADRLILMNGLKCILINLYIAFLNRKNLIMPKNERFYKELEPDLSEKNLSVIQDLILWLKNNLYIGERLGNPEDGASCYWPLPKLYQELEKIPSDTIAVTYENDTCVIIKDEHKQVILNVSLSDKGQDYFRKLTEINNAYARHRFSCIAADNRLHMLYPSLRAIFNDSSWDRGGRLYSFNSCGLNYQDIPSDLRETIMIDDQKTIELDYSALHISMLYAQEHISPPPSPYDIGTPLMRSLCKQATLLLLNASNKEQVIYLLKKNRDDLSGKSGLSPRKVALRDALSACDDFCALLSKIEQYHQQIRKYFYTGIGIELQSRDSMMALTIVDFFRVKDIPVLPVHDSFIIGKQYKSELAKEMHTAFSAFNNHFDCVVK